MKIELLTNIFILTQTKPQIDCETQVYFFEISTVKMFSIIHQIF